MAALSLAFEQSEDESSPESEPAGDENEAASEEE